MSKPVNIVVPGLMLLLGILIGMILNYTFVKEGFQDSASALKAKCGSGSNGGSDGGSGTSPTCAGCCRPFPCGCPSPRLTCPPCREPDLSKYVLKSTIPPCPPMPDLSKYMLKTECPPVPDLSNYVLKSSVPKPQPVILDCSKCSKPSGECPPCPRPRCPEVKCPEPIKCPPPAPCPRQVCPPSVVKCKAEDAPIQQVRPYLAPLSVTGFGLG
jgi:hypothetical protein